MSSSAAYDGWRDPLGEIAHMSDLLVRYTAGDCQAVRDALKASIDSDSSPDQLAVATAVADEFVSRAARNLARLHEALVAVGYEFADAPNALVLNDEPDERSVAEFEKQMGKMPLIASRWYRRIKSVDFSQSLEQLKDRQSPLSALGWGVRFIVQSFEKAQEHWAEHRRERQKNDRQRVEFGVPAIGPLTPRLFTGGCASSNECMGFDLPSSRFDDVLYDEGEGDQYFGDEIAGGFAAGGLPILCAPKRILKVVRSVYGEPDRAYLSGRLPANYEPM